MSIDRSVVTGEVYFYRLEAVARNGASELFGPVMVRVGRGSSPRPRNELAASRPNPFAGDQEETRIGFELAHRSQVRLELFDVSGRLVRVLLNETRDAGRQEAPWDGRDARGEAVGAGVYFYRLEAGEFQATRSLVRLR